MGSGTEIPRLHLSLASLRMKNGTIMPALLVLRSLGSYLLEK